MKRVYTDERCPGYEIVNNGPPVFEVFLEGNLVSSFESWDQPDGTITEACAGRRAEDFFKRIQNVPQMELEAWEVPVPCRSTSMEIDQTMAKARAETVPEHRLALRRHALELMRQEESLAEAVVNHLIESH